MAGPPLLDRSRVKGRPVTELTADGLPSSPVSGVSSTRVAAGQQPAAWLRLAGSGSVAAATAATARASAE
jgi:hypothetical protein